jgi:hypothetical protein
MAPFSLVLSLLAQEAVDTSGDIVSDAPEYRTTVAGIAGRGCRIVE